MKENLRRLNLLFRITLLKPEMFYSIRISDYSLILQGYPSVEMEKLKKRYESERFIIVLC
jgi:hypothetical protein